MLQPIYTYGLPFALSATGLVYTGAGALSGIVVSSHTNGTLKLWDNITGSGTVLIDTFTFPTGSGSYSFFGAKFKTGLFATVGGTLVATLLTNPYQG